jgi:hypothetical protein
MIIDIKRIVVPTIGFVQLIAKLLKDYVQSIGDYLALVHLVRVN